MPETPPAIRSSFPAVVWNCAGVASATADATVFVPLAFAITAVCAPLSSVSPCPESV